MNIIGELLIMVKRGNTVRLIGQFYDWDDNPADPDSVTLIIYDNKRVKIDEVVPLKIEVGKYFYDYVAEKEGSYYYEFKGVIGETPSLNRATFSVHFY